MERPAAPASLDAGAFEINHATVRDGVKLAYVREGIGGVPILMLHGWPGTKRIFYRNIRPLVEAGFEVIAPDVRGWGDSWVPTDPADFADPPRAARDFKALMEQLGHERWVTAAFDFGGVTALDMCNRFPDQVIRQIFWNTLVPVLPEEYEKAGVGGDQVVEVNEISTHPFDHGSDTDAFVDQFESDQERREYVMAFYQGRAWKPGDPVRGLAAMGSFDDAAARFHAEAFEAAAVFRSSLNFYSVFVHPDRFSEPPLLAQKCDTQTFLMWGLGDEINPPDLLIKRAEIGYTNLVGPFLVADAGHFLSWERPEVINSAIVCFCRDLLG